MNHDRGRNLLKFVTAIAALSLIVSFISPMQSAFAAAPVTVTFNANGGTGTMAAQSTNKDTSLTLNAFSRAGYRFVHWNTVANDSGTSYVDGAIFPFSTASNTTLYAQWTPTYTVTYNGNGSTSGTVPVDGSSPYLNGATVTVLANTGTLAKIGSVFANWNTAADGSGTNYSAGNTFAIAANTILYAKWATTYTVTYFPNGSTGGTVPVDGSSPYASGATVTVLGNTGSLVKTGSVFSNWNTAANGSGTQYAPSATFTIGANTILYAQWRSLVTYNSNGATGGSVPVDPSSPYLDNSTVSVLGNTGSLVRTGYNFASWNTAADGSGITYSSGNTFVVSVDTVLYAQWSVVTYTVTYNSNGATGGTVPVDSSSPYANGATVTVLGNTGSLVRTGYNFASWNTATDGSGTSYSAGNTFSIGANTTLYAQWAITYTVTYNGNAKTGGSTPVTVSYASGATVTVSGNTGSLVKTGYTFSNWNTVVDGSGTQYAPGDTFVIGANVVLYAQWTGTVTYDANGATGGSVPTDSSSPYLANATVTVLGNTGSLVRIGNTFANWNTAANGSGSIYSAGNMFEMAGNTVLYAQWHATVTYNGNGSTSGTVPVDGSSPYLNGATVTVHGNTGTLAKIGSVFANWNTAADGSGTNYSAGNTFAIAADTILYAKWATTYTVTYFPNGSTGGTVPVDGSSPYASGATVTVLGNTGSLTKTDSTFAGWNTALNGSGTSYAPGLTFVIGTNTILYAQWTITATYTVIYNSNGSTGGSVPVDSSSPYLSGSAVTVLGNSGFLVKTGYVFDSWNTAADGSGTEYAPADTFSIGANTTLYAVWGSVGSSSVSYSGNGATGGAVPHDGLSPYTNGLTVTVLGNTGSLVRSGYAFANWNTAADGSGTSYSAGNTFTISTNTILYAQWTAAYSVIYDEDGANGGTVPVDGSSPYLYGATVTVLDNTGALYRTASIFAGWNTAEDGSGTAYGSGATFTIVANTVLYAQWTVTVTYNSNGATGGSVPVDSSSPYPNGATATVLGNTGSLVKTGYTFAGWNTAEDGSGDVYEPGGSFVIAANTVLYAQWTLVGTFAVTYSGNGSTSGTVPVDTSSPYADGASVTVLGNTGTLAKMDFVFLNWNTAADGSGTNYSAGNAFSIAANTVLYAKWANSYTVIYHGNGSNGGSVPTDASSPYISGATVTVLGNTGSLTKTGTVFDNWNTAMNGSGTPYSAGDTFAIGATSTLYAQWRATVTYNANGATSGTVPIDTSSPYLVPLTATFAVTVLGNSGSLSKIDYTFSHWNTAANGTGISYSTADTFLISANTVLYAQWAIASTETVTYSGNGATGGAVPHDGLSPYTNGLTVTVLGNTGSLVRSGYAFANWNTAADGSGTSYSAGNTFTISTNTILYAQWTATYSVIYDEDGANGGTVPVDGSSPYLYGATVTVLDNTGALYRTASIFAGWNTAEDGTGTPYAPGATFAIADNMVLYVQWTVTVTYNSNGATGGSVPVDSSSPYPNGATVTVLGNTGSLVKTGYTFAHWCTAFDDSGTHYSSGDTFDIETNTVLYAQWTLVGTNTVTYSGNGFTSGTAPVDASSPYADGASVTVLGNTGTLAKIGSVFANWNTAADGSGTNYSVGNTFTIAANTVLYAKWIASYTLIYRPAGSTGGVVPVDGSSPYVSGATVTVLGNTGGLVRTGTTFANWNTAVDGSGTTYAPGATFNIAADTLLFALWTSSVTYNANGATGGSVPVDSSSPYITAYNSDTQVTVLGNTGGLTKAGYSFSHWNTAANGTGISYSATDTFLIAANTVLYAQWVTETLTVTYSGNGSTSGNVPVDPASPYSIGSTVTVLGNSGSLAKIGYRFSHWNTAANGSGISYSAGDVFAIGADTVLYVQWSHVYTLTYDGDGAIGGTVPVDGSSPYLYGATVTVLDNTGALYRTESTFAGWNTVEDGSGTTYAVGATFSISSDMVLYAAWSATVTYVANGATGGTVPVDSRSPYMNGSTVTVLGNTGSLVKTGYTFVHWHTTTDVSTINYAPGDSFVITANTVLYAAWVPEGSRTIAYNANGATGGRAPTDTASPYLEDSMVTVLGNTGLLTRAGYTFANWNTVSNGSGTAYSGGDTFAIAYNTILYAQWTPEMTTYTVTFNGNGSTSGSTTAQMSGVSTPLVSNGFLRFGYVFAGWNTSPEGSGATYADGAVYSFASDVTLYAQWTTSAGGSSTVQPGPPIATVEVPVTHLVTATIESTVEASIAVGGGTNVSVAVTVPAGAVTEDVTIAIAPAATSAGTSTGVVSINVTATNAAGVLITHFNKPLAINLGQMATGTTVAFSQNGIIWTNIQLLSGTTLPDGVHEGYYLAADGSVMILTDHLTYFGLKMAQTPLVLHANSNQIPLGAFAAIYTTGGSGSGTGTYLTTTPAICSVNQYGLVIGLKAGKCTVLATKAGDGTYLNASTAPLDLIYIDLTPTLPVLPSLPSTGVPVSLAKSVTITGVTLSKLILVNLGASFGGKTANIQIRKVGSATYQTLCVVTLNKAGVVRTTRRIPLGSTIRVLLGGKSQAVTVVR